MQDRESSFPLLGAIGALPRSAWFHLTAIGCGLALAMLGPFGTFDTMTMPSRLVFWVALCWLNSIQTALICIAVLRRWVKPDAASIPLAQMIIMALLNGAPGTLEVFAGLRLLGDGITATVPQLFRLYLQTVFITLILIMLFQLLTRWRMAAGADESDAATQSGLQARIPAKIRGRLLSVSAQDHYLRIVTDQGETLVPGRFRDALALLAGEQGVRIHRSHWVAHTAIERVRRRDGKIKVILCNGETLPVSRSYTATLREAGW